jgi:hypothetical protein
MERPDARACSRFPRSRQAYVAPNVTSIEKEDEEAVDAQPASGGGDTEEGSRKRARRCNTRSTFETSRCNNCNILLKQMKHLKHASKTRAKTHEKHFKTIVKHTQHRD